MKTPDSPVAWRWRGGKWWLMDDTEVLAVVERIAPTLAPEAGWQGGTDHADTDVLPSLQECMRATEKLLTAGEAAKE